MIDAEEAWAAAWFEGEDAGLVRRATWIHAVATYWLARIGFDFPARPDIISGFRSPERQAELLERWLAGDRQGIAARPACRSWHTVGRAWDVQTQVQGFQWYRYFCEYLGARWGGRFSSPDVPHFDLPGPEDPPNICQQIA